MMFFGRLASLGELAFEAVKVRSNLGAIRSLGLGDPTRHQVILFRPNRSGNRGDWKAAS
jgi:hypothetical protein